MLIKTTKNVEIMESTLKQTWEISKLIWKQAFFEVHEWFFYYLEQLFVESFDFWSRNRRQQTKLHTEYKYENQNKIKTVDTELFFKGLINPLNTLSRQNVPNLNLEKKKNFLRCLGVDLSSFQA